ncbi:hypothetical protein KY317_02620 [Candidatus Woesearchaeota archaeon]|nr:hypothetical protein [Candidatus Woesearchaeota archaeon]
MHKMKKGESVVLLIFGLVAVVSVSLIFILISTALAEQSTSNNILAAEQIVMSGNALMAATGNAWIEIPINLSRYIIEFDKNNVIVYMDESDSPAERVKRHFVSYGNIGIKGVFKHESTIYLVKEGKSLRVATKRPVSKLVEQVPSVDTANSNWKSGLIVFSPLSSNGVEDIFVKELGDYFKRRSVNAEPSNLKADETPILRLTAKELDDIRIIKIYYSSAREQEKSRKLAIILKNKLLASLDKVTFRILSGEGYEFEYADISSVIEISKDIRQENMYDIISAIYAGVEDYYG